MRWLLLLLLLLPGAARAELTPLDYHYFSRTPVLHEGRIKPLKSFARIELKQLSGESGDASAWLAMMLFDPASAWEKPLLHVPSTELQGTLSLPERKSNRYSLAETTLAIEQHAPMMAALLQKEEAALSPLEHALLKLYGNINTASELIRSFALVLPFGVNLPEELRAELGLPEGALNYLDLAKVKETLLAQVKEIATQKSSAVAEYTASEQLKARLAMQLQVMEETGAQNQLLRVLPSPWNSGEWLAPWAMLLEGKAAPQTGKLLEQWQGLAAAYQQGDAVTWARISQQLYTEAPVHHWKLELEHWYYALELVTTATALYALAFLLLVVIPTNAGIYSKVSTRGKMDSRLRGNDRIIISFLSGALLVHGALLLSRILILGRPPVSTLYESVLFVSFIIALAATLWPGRSFRHERWIAASGLSALLLAISNTYATESDTMGVLIAVLNTNFWLATHVICITAGYGWCLMAGTLAHFWLLRHARIGHKLPASPPAYLHILTIIALLFTALGTILGGIWADQSWGRFWGWDPKENGALLIVLWLAWVLHGKVSGQLRATGFAAMLAFVNVVVALSWFGVNLLNTGLHSYGFTNSAAFGLAAFCAAELMFITITYGLARRNA